MKGGVEKYHALQQAALTITSELSLDRVLKKIVDAARDLAQAQYAALGVAREDRKGLVQFIVSGLTDRQIAAIGPWPRGLGLLGVLLQDPRPLRVPSITADPRSIGFPPGHPTMTSFLGVPIISKGTILGNFYLANKIDAEAFSEDDEELIVALAAFAAMTIENARLCTETDAQLKLKLKALERAEQRAKLLLELSALLPTGPLAEELPLEEVLARASSQLGDACAAYLVTPDAQLDRKVVVHRDPARAAAAEASLDELWAGISEQVLRQERAFLVADVDALLVPLPGSAVQAMKARGFTAGLAVPIKSTKHVFGVFLSLASQPLKLSDDDFLFGQLVAARLGTALENASLLRELRGVVSARDQSIAELRMAQKGLSHLAAIVESSDDSIVSWTLDGIIASWNPGAERLYGYSAEEAIGQPVSMLFSLDRPGELPGIIERLQQGQPVPPFETVHLCRDGRRIPVSTRVSPIKDKSGSVIGASSVTRDISELKRAEEARKQSEEALRMLSAAIEQSPSAVIITDTQARIEYVNPKFTELTGYTAEEVKGQNPRFLKSGHTSAEEYRRLWDTITSGRMWRGHFLNKKKSGELYWESASIAPITDVAGAITHYIAVKQDISERKAADAERERLLAAVQRQAAELDAIIASIADMVLIYDTEGKIVRLNETAEKVLGYSPAERDLPLAERATVFHLETADGRPVPPEDLPAARALRGETLKGFVVRLQRGDRTFWVMTSAAPLRAADGTLSGAVITMSDITALHELQERQKEFISLISHDLRSPLSSVMGTAQLLQQGFEREGRAREARGVGALVKSAKRMAAMIDDLVDSARLEAGQLEMRKQRTDLLQLVSDLVERVGMPRDRERIRVEASEAVPAVLADPQRLERAITNLLTNALKYSPADKPVVIAIARQDEKAVVSVSDQGVGIPPEDLPHLFQRHFRAKTAGKQEGLGLGLYITRLIVEAHGGMVGVESEVGKGSTFYIDLPVAGGEPDG